MIFFISVWHCYSCQHQSHISWYCGKLKSGLLAQLCLQIYCNFRRRIKEIGTQARSGGKQANPVETFIFFAILQTITNCVAVIMLVTCADRPGSNTCVETNFFYACFDYLTIVDIIFITFFLILYIN